MTTIAANKFCMAADTKIVHGETFFHGAKIYRVGRSIIGAAGDASDIAKWLRWYRRGGKGPKPEFGRKPNIDVLVLNPNGLFFSDDACEFEPIEEESYAIGNGQVAALVAMDLGCDPGAAIEAVCKRDNATGSPVQVLTLQGHDETKSHRQTSGRRNKAVSVGRKGG